MWMILAVLVVFGARVWSLYEDAQTKFVNITMKSSIAGTAKIYYDLGKGLSEKNSSSAYVNKNGALSHYQFHIPDERIYSLRFDPAGGHVEIQGVRIADGLGNTFKRFDLSQLKPHHQISKFEIVNDQAFVDMAPEADDPQIYILPKELLPIFEKINPSFYIHVLLNFFVVLLLVFFIYLWVNWNDPKNMKKWGCYGLIAMGFVIITFYGVQTCLGILNRDIQPFGGGDTEVFLHMAALKWTNPYFYHGLRPWTVPILHSLVGGAKNIHNILLLQTIISYVSWIFLAFMVVCFSKDYLVKVFAFFLIAFIPLSGFIHHYHLVILSESLSFSFFAVFLGAYLWYTNKRSILLVVFLAIVALLFAFTRDTDAYRVLLMTLPILLLIVHAIRNKTRGVMHHIVLSIIFILIFIGSNYSTSNIQCRDCVTSYMNARWFMPIVNNVFQRILPYEDRLKYFEDHGLPVTPALMAMKHKWASSNNWQSTFDPKLAAEREWIYRHGRQTYMKYLITHPKYTFSSAFDYRDALLYLNGERNAWYQGTAKPFDARFVFFLNDDRDLKMFLVLFLASLILVLTIYVRHGKDNRGHIMRILLIGYVIIIAIPLGMLIFHGDLMDLARHSYTNIIQLNLGFVLFYLYMADLLMMKMKKGAIK